MANFQEQTNEWLGLTSTATASDRKEGLRELGIQGLVRLCYQFDPFEAAWAFYQDFITQLEQWDVISKDGRFYAVWGDLIVHVNPTQEGAAKALRTFVDALYPVSFAQAEAITLRRNEGMYETTYDGAIVGRGIDPYSACIDLLTHRLALQEDGLIGPLFDQELEAVHG